MIRFKCIYCGQRILAKDDGRGKKGTCPGCDHQIIVPYAPKDTAQIDINKISLPPVSFPAAKEHIPEHGKDPSVIVEFPPPDSSDDTTDIFEEKLGFLIPTYDELSLFLTAITFLILYFTNGKMQDDVSHFLMRLDIWRRYIYIALFSVGMLLCLYHVFASRKKTYVEKAIMLLFAVTMNAATGLIAGFYMLKEPPSWLLVFPIWNIINSALMIIMQYVDLFDESHISDRNATAAEIIIGLIAVLVIFVFCNFVFKLHWAITFSICIIYTTSFDRALQSVFPGIMSKDADQSQ